MKTTDNRTLSRRAVIGGALGSAVLLACGDSSDNGGAQTASSPTPASTASPSTAAVRLRPLSPAELGAPAVPPAVASTSSSAVPFAPAVAPYANFGTTAAAGVFPRSVRHAMGTAELSRAPSRVVALDTGEMDAVVDLGLKPAGVIDWTGSGVPAYLQSSLQDVEIVGSIQEPDAEKVVGLNPDLILTNKQRHEAIFGTLNAIAPAVYGERAGLVWRYNFELYARALGREEQGAAVIKRYEDKIKALNAKLPSPRPTISIIRVTATNLRYYMRASFTSSVLEDLGFPRPELQNVDDFALNNQGLETVGQYGAGDVIVLSIIGGDGNEFAKTLQESPLWQSLQAVKDGKVLTVDDSTWIAGLGYRAADVIADDLARFFKV